VTNPELLRKDSPFDYSIPFRGSVWISVSSEQREMGDEGRGGGEGQDQGTSSLVKNRSAERPPFQKPKTKGWGTREETCRAADRRPTTLQGLGVSQADSVGWYLQ